MNKQNQWLFEAPFASYTTESSSSKNFECMTEMEASTAVLQSPRFRNDSRLQAAANNRPPMRQGERGIAVQKLQQALIDLGFPMPISTRRRGTPDGIYGSETTATVRQFQQKYSLKVDGVVGRNTISRLDQLFKPICGVPQKELQGINLEQGSAKSIIPQPKPILCLFQDTLQTKHFFNGANNWAKKIQAIAINKSTPTACQKVGATPYRSGDDIVKAIKNASLCLNKKLTEIHIFSHSSPEGVGGLEFCTGLYRDGLSQKNGDTCFSIRQGGKRVSAIPTNVLDENVVFFLHGCRTAAGCGGDKDNFARALFKHLSKNLDNPRVYGHLFRTCAGQECNWCEYSKSFPKGRHILRIPSVVPIPYRIKGMPRNPCKKTECSLKK